MPEAKPGLRALYGNSRLLHGNNIPGAPRTTGVRADGNFQEVEESAGATAGSNLREPPRWRSRPSHSRVPITVAAQKAQGMPGFLQNRGKACRKRANQPSVPANPAQNASMRERSVSLREKAHRDITSKAKGKATMRSIK